MKAEDLSDFIQKIQPFIFEFQTKIVNEVFQHVYDVMDSNGVSELSKERMELLTKDYLAKGDKWKTIV